MTTYLNIILGQEFSVMAETIHTKANYQLRNIEEYAKVNLCY